jgi:hypothetical protein
MLEFNIDGYQLIDSFCRKKHRGGGVLICAKETTDVNSYTSILNPLIATKGDMEFATSKIKIDKNS